MKTYPLPSGEFVESPVTAIDPTSGAFIFLTSSAARRWLNGTLTTIAVVPAPSLPPTFLGEGILGGLGVDNNGTVYAAQGYIDTSPDCSLEACSYAYIAATPKSGPPIFLDDSGNLFSPVYPDATTDEKNRYLGLINIIFGGPGSVPLLQIIDLTKAGSRVTYVSVGPAPPLDTSTIGTAIARGTNGLTWVATTQYGDDITRVSDSGAMHTFAIATNSDVQGLATDGSGNVWFTDTGHSKIGRMMPDGSYTEYLLPSNAAPSRITLGGDGALWFIEPPRLALGRMTTSGKYSEYALPASAGAPTGISGPGHLPGCDPNVLYIAGWTAIVKVTVTP